jgi:hypothetical protein
MEKEESQISEKEKILNNGKVWILKQVKFNIYSIL